MTRRFLAKLLLFVLPVAAIFSIPIALTVYMGEAMPVRAVVTLQMGQSPVLYGPTDRDPIVAYKLLAVQMRRPAVLFIGSSRILQFRSLFLDKNSAAFYNAGGQAWGMDEIRTLVEHLDRTQLPKILVVGLDQVWFNRDYVDWEEPHALSTDEFGLSRIIGGSRKLIDTLIAGDIQLDAVLDREAWVRGAVGLGLDALQYGRGYRNDGSHQEGDLLTTPELGELARKHDLEMAPEGWRQFVQGNDVSGPMIGELDAFLQWAESEGVTVIGIGPPYMPSIYDLMMAGGKNEYLPKSAVEIDATFTRHGFHYFDFSNAAWVGGTDEDMYDGWHSSELLSLRMYIVMLNALPDILGPYSDVETLEREAAQAENPLEVFGNRF